MRCTRQPSQVSFRSNPIQSNLSEQRWGDFPALPIVANSVMATL